MHRQKKGWAARLLGIFSTGHETAHITQKPLTTAPQVPDNTQIYAVGDIHGRVDLLRKLHDLILQDSAQLAENIRRIVVYLGDYIDRGDDSKDVIDVLLQDALPNFSSIYLKGNHEMGMDDFLANPSAQHPWLSYGGMSTLLSYGVTMGAAQLTPNTIQSVRDQLHRAILEGHHLFFTRLRLRYQIGDYFFVHAGIRPGIALEQQNPQDFMIIREPFLHHKQPHEKFIVHGHTVSDNPEIRSNRIGIDTGAFYSGKLTSLVLTKHEQRFLST